MNEGVLQELIRVLEKDVREWESAATTCDYLIPHLAGESQKEQFRAKAAWYRARAQEIRQLIELVKTEQGSGAN